MRLEQFAKLALRSPTLQGGHGLKKCDSSITSSTAAVVGIRSNHKVTMAGMLGRKLRRHVRTWITFCRIMASRNMLMSSESTGSTTCMASIRRMNAVELSGVVDCVGMCDSVPQLNIIGRTLAASCLPLLMFTIVTTIVMVGLYQLLPYMDVCAINRPSRGYRDRDESGLGFCTW